MIQLVAAIRQSYSSQKDAEDECGIEEDSESGSGRCLVEERKTDDQSGGLCFCVGQQAEQEVGQA